MNAAINSLLAQASLRPTGRLALLIGLAGLILRILDVGGPEWLGVAIVLVPIGIVSYRAPRWADRHGLTLNHPVALVAYTTALICWLVPPALRWAFGVDLVLTGEDVMTLAGLLGAAWSLPTPIEEPADDSLPVEVAELPELTRPMIDMDDGTGFDHVDIDPETGLVPIDPAQEIAEQGRDDRIDP